MVTGYRHAQAISEFDRRLVLATQGGLPLTTRPYQTLAESLGSTEEIVRERLQVMLDAGVIRRLGAVPNHYRLGFGANGMSVWDVDDDHVAELGPRVGNMDFVSHAYRRPRKLPHWPYNLFAMVHGRSREEVSGFVERIAKLLGDRQRQHDILFSSRILKKTGLRLEK